jgi:hypothetical protein
LFYALHSVILRSIEQICVFSQYKCSTPLRTERYTLTIVAVQRLCICAFPFKARFLFNMKNTVITMVVAFFICVIMTLPYFMISNVTAKIIVSTNNVTMLICDVDDVLSKDFISAYIYDYLPYFRLFGLQILPMCIVLFLSKVFHGTIYSSKHKPIYLVDMI